MSKESIRVVYQGKDPPRRNSSTDEGVFFIDCVLKNAISFILGALRGGRKHAH